LKHVLVQKKQSLTQGDFPAALWQTLKKRLRLNFIFLEDNKRIERFLAPFDVQKKENRKREGNRAVGAFREKKMNSMDKQEVVFIGGNIVFIGNRIFTRNAQ